MIRRSLLVLSVALALSSSQARADMATYTFSGTIDSAYALGTSTLPPGVAVGSTFTGTLTLNTSIVGSYGNSPNIQFYQASVLNETFTIGSTTYSEAMVLAAHPNMNNNDVVEYNYNVGSGMKLDAFNPQVSSNDTSVANHSIVTQLGMSFNDEEVSPTALSSDAQPTGPLDLSKFISGHSISYVDYDYNSATSTYGHYLYVDGVVNSITAVPAPPALALLGSGLVALSSLGRVIPRSRRLAGSNGS